jgi:hypothetical protein
LHPMAFVEPRKSGGKIGKGSIQGAYPLAFFHCKVQTRMADRLIDLRKKGFECLRIQIELSLPLAIGPRVNKIPTIARCERKSSSGS